MSSIIIDPEFKEAMRPLRAEVYELLEASILENGCRQPLDVWQGILIDGHNRLEICEKHGVEYRTVDVDLPDRDAVFEWIDKVQLTRRNLTRDEFTETLGRYYNRRKKRVGAPEGNKNQKGQLGQNGPIVSTADEVAEEFGVSPRTVKRAGKAAETLDANPDLKEAVHSGDLPLKVATQAATIPEPERREILSSPEPAKAIKAHVAHNSGENEWYTPAVYIEAARTAMGSIDCDPASCAFANETVQAEKFYDIEANGLIQKWHGNVWMNPPYAQPAISDFAKALAEKYDANEFDQAIVLVNNATETEWFRRMSSVASAICFPKGRIKFIDKNGKPSGAPLQGQAFLYMGDNAADFVSGFSYFGECWSRQ